MLHLADVRYAFRLLRRSPLFSLLTVVVLSGGLGLSIFTFSFLHTAMLKPLPLAGGERIVRIEQETRGTSSDFDVVDVAAVRASITTLNTVGAFTNGDVVIGDERHRRVLNATATEPNMFELTRTRPMLGRVLRAEDQARGAEPVIVLGQWAWRVVFGADSSIVGTMVPLNGAFTRVVGVMPDGYGFPVASDAWTPLGADVLASTTAGVQGVSLYARLANGVSRDQAAVELRQLLDRAVKARTTGSTTPAEPVAVAVRTFPMAQIGDDGPLALTVLNLLASLILLLACINVTNLLLARANERARETAVRLALGASRGRLIMQSMWENIVLCVAGGVLATTIAAWGLSAINAWMQNNLQRNLAFWWVWHLDRAALLSAGAFVTLTIAVLGGVVSARVANTEFNTVLRDGGTRSGSRREGRIARGLVITQVATVSVLMFFGVMSGVVAYRVANVNVGYDTHNLLSASVAPPIDRKATPGGRATLFQTVADQMNASPTVNGAVLRTQLAAATDDDGAFELGVSRTPGTASPHAYIVSVLGPVGVTGVSLSSGRLFDARDDERGARVAMVSRALAQKYWPGASPVGQQIRLAADSANAPPRTVVGIVNDILMGNPFARNRSPLAAYVPLRQSGAQSAEVMFRHRGDAAAAQAALYRTLTAIDPRVVPPTVATYDEILGKTTLIAKSVTKLFALCFGFALLLAVSGTYGLMARAIGQRTREMGIRRALGATDRGLIELLLQQGGRQLGVGVVIALPIMVAVGVGFWQFFPIGLAVSLAAAAGVATIIVGVVLLATYIPTRRVLAVSPRDALWRD